MVASVAYEEMCHHSLPALCGATRSGIIPYDWAISVRIELIVGGFT